MNNYSPIIVLCRLNIDTIKAFVDIHGDIVDRIERRVHFNISMTNISASNLKLRYLLHGTIYLLSIVCFPMVKWYLGVFYIVDIHQI